MNRFGFSPAVETRKTTTNSWDAAFNWNQRPTCNHSTGLRLQQPIAARKIALFLWREVWLENLARTHDWLAALCVPWLQEEAGPNPGDEKGPDLHVQIFQKRQYHASQPPLVSGEDYVYCCNWNLSRSARRNCATVKSFLEKEIGVGNPAATKSAFPRLQGWFRNFFASSDPHHDISKQPG